MRRLFIVLSVLMLTLEGVSIARSQSATTIRVVVHAENPTQSLTRAEVSDFLLKKATYWPDGLPVMPVDQRSGVAVREAFSLAIHGRSVDRINNYWQRKIFAGRDVPPPQLDSDAAVIAFVRSERGAVGYVGPGADTTGVKVVPLSD